MCGPFCVEWTDGICLAVSMPSANGDGYFIYSHSKQNNFPSRDLNPDHPGGKTGLGLGLGVKDSLLYFFVISNLHLSNLSTHLCSGNAQFTVTRLHNNITRCHLIIWNNILTNIFYTL